MAGLDAVLAEYCRLHPGTEYALERPKALSDLPLSDFLRAVHDPGASFDLVQCFSAWAMDAGAHGNLVMRLGAYLDLENPYAQGKTWKDLIQPTYLDAMRDGVYGDVWALPFACVTVRGFANGQLLQENGLAVPTTWGDFLRAHEALKKAGVVPCIMSTSPPPGPAEWVLDCLESMVLQNKVAEWDSRDSDGSLDRFEMLVAAQKGDLSLKDPEVQEGFRLLNAWAQYWQPGFDKESSGSGLDKFVAGGVGFYFDSMTRWKSIRDKVAAQGNFPLFVFPVPRLDPSDSPYADGVYYEEASTKGLELAIPSTIEKQGGDRLKRAVDVLQFITSPAGQAVAANSGWLLTVGQGVPLPAEFDPFRPRMLGGPPIKNPFFLTEPLREAWLGQGHFLKTLTDPWNRDKFLEDMGPIFDKDMKIAVPREIQTLQQQIAYHRGAYSMLELRHRMSKAQKDERLTKIIETNMRRTWLRMEDKQDTLNYLARVYGLSRSKDAPAPAEAARPEKAAQPAP